MTEMIWPLSTKGKHAYFMYSSLQFQCEVTEIMPSIFRSKTALSVLKILSQRHSCVVTTLWELFSNLKQVHSCSALRRCVIVGLYIRAEVRV